METLEKQQTLNEQVTELGNIVKQFDDFVEQNIDKKLTEFLELWSKATNSKNLNGNFLQIKICSIYANTLSYYLRAKEPYLYRSILKDGYKEGYEKTELHEMTAETKSYILKNLPRTIANYKNMLLFL